MKQVYIYALVRNMDNYIFYIGLSTNLPQRLQNHRAGWKKTNDRHLVHKYIRECNNDISIIPIQQADLNIATLTECYYISYAQHLGFDLANIIGSFKKPFNDLNQSIYGVSDEGIKTMQSLYLENKSKYFW